jgi:menaquinone-9 beta-reductase
MRRAEPFDVAVVGGGPAGSATAIHLVRAGFRVALVDRSAFPRKKACGECLNPAAVAALGRIGLLGEVLAAGATPLRGWRIYPIDGPPLVGLLPADRPGVAVPRERLDSILLEAARREGVEVRLGERVIDLLRDEDRVVGIRTDREEVPARLVVGADGLRSVVLRKLGLLRRGPRLRKLALSAHVERVGARDEWGCLHLMAGGSVGVAEVARETANVVVVVNSTHAHEVAGRREAFFDGLLHTLPGLESARRVDDVLATGPFDFPVRAATADGALLVGDAAGYYDPFTGQGIYRALRGAELAATTASDALRNGGCAAAHLRSYEEARRRLFRPGEWVQRVIEAVVSRPALFAAVARELEQRTSIVDALIETAGDVRTVRSFLMAAGATLARFPAAAPRPG